MGDPTELDFTDKLVFVSKWYDYERCTLKHFWLTFYPFDNSVELYDKDRSRIYLKRAIYDGVSAKDMFVGNTVRIYGRQIDIVDYADVRTKNLVSKKNERTLAILKPTSIKNLGPILSFIIDKNFRIMKLKMCELTRPQAMEFYEDKKADPFLPFMLEQIVSGPIIAAEIVGENAIERWKELMGPKDPAVARHEKPDSLRAIYGQELASNGFHGPDTEEQAEKEANYFFPSATSQRKPPKNTAKIMNSTCCIVKPHALEEGKLGEIINEILKNRYKITAMQMYYISNANAEEFLEVYKGVVSDFNALMLSFIDGPCIAMEITGEENMDVHGEFRKFSGPSDPDIARQIRPNTLRAKFGVDKYKNAVHCTDLPEDTMLELEYFFRILDD